jgi:uncharacterized repeat protein (TIGR03803 family)
VSLSYKSRPDIGRWLIRHVYCRPVQATDGNLYGAAYEGGTGTGGICTSGCGTVFKTTLSGGLTTLHNFDLTDGADPAAQLVQAEDGTLYGTTAFGGTSSACSDLYHCGAVFKMTLSGTLTTLYSFCSQGGCTDGFTPTGALVQAEDGNFYGTTPYGGAGGLYDGTTASCTKCERKRIPANRALTDRTGGNCSVTGDEALPALRRRGDDPLLSLRGVYGCLQAQRGKAKCK